MSALDELYVRALQYRDNKVSECSPDDSKTEAERLFLELSQLGHAKAMHNYAVLQQKKGNYKLATEWFDKAGLDASMRNLKAMKELGQIKEDLYLVVANDRSEAGNHGSPILDHVYGTTVDLTHLHSFGGEATTCDINCCAIPGAKHITADALTFDFAKKYNLKHVLLERPPTINPATPGESKGIGSVSLDTIACGAHANFLGSMVQNLSKAMEPGAVLEIEWDPYTTQAPITSQKCVEYHVLDPFHGYMILNAGVLGVQCMDPACDISMHTPELQAIAFDAAKKFRTELEFWHDQGGDSSLQEIMSRMLAEVRLFTYLMNKQSLHAFVEANIHRDSTEKVVAALESATFNKLDPTLIGKPFQCVETGQRGKVYSASTLISDSLYGAAVNSLAVQSSWPYAKRFLERIDFEEVVLERRTNIHNGRKNVWMITAVKA